MGEEFLPEVRLSKKMRKKLRKSEKALARVRKEEALPVDVLMQQPHKSLDIIPEEMRVQWHDGGVFLGLDPLDDAPLSYIGKSQEDDGHVLIVGGPGCHKTTGVILPTILAWKGTFVAVDIKGDISEFCRRHQNGIACSTQILDFANGESTVRYDPFLRLRQAEKAELSSSARDLALSMIPIPNDVREPFWVQGAQNILAAIILYAINRDMDFNAMVEMTLTTPVAEIQKAIEGSGIVEAKSFMNQYIMNQGTDDRTLLGSFIELTNHLRDFATIGSQGIFSASEDSIDWETHTFSQNLVIRIPESRLNQYSGAVRVILRQLFSVLAERPDKYSPLGRRLPPFLLLWDEMPRFGKFEDLPNAFSTLRSRGVTICAAIQSFAQLDHIYGSSLRRVLVDCCNYIVIGTVQDVETQKYCSELIGFSSQWQPSIGETYHPERHEFAFSRSLNPCREPIFYPEDFSTLADFIVATPYGKFCVKKSPLIEDPQVPFDRRYKLAIRKPPDVPQKETKKNFSRKILEADISSYEKKQHPSLSEPARDESVKTNIEFCRNQIIGEILTKRFPELECFQPKLNEGDNKTEFQSFDELLEKISSQKTFQKAMKKMLDEKSKTPNV